MRIVHLYRADETIAKPRRPTKKDEQKSRVELMLKEQRFQDRKKALQEYAPKFQELKERRKKLAIKFKNHQHEINIRSKTSNHY